MISSKMMAQKPPPPPKDPIDQARRKHPSETAVDWSKYKQRGPSCDLDTNGDPKPPKVTRR